LTLVRIARSPGIARSSSQDRNDRSIKTLLENKQRENDLLEALQNDRSLTARASICPAQDDPFYPLHPNFRANLFYKSFSELHLWLNSRMAGELLFSRSCATSYSLAGPCSASYSLTGPCTASCMSAKSLFTLWQVPLCWSQVRQVAFCYSAGPLSASSIYIYILID
jgi:hypothetical protein